MKTRFLMVPAFLVVTGMLLATSGQVQAGTIVHSNRTVWGAAVGTHSIQDFNSYVADASFLNTTLNIGHGMSITTAGSPLSGRNMIDVPPFIFGRTIDGTADIMPDVNPSSIFSVSFATPVTGWGADVRYMDSGTTINLYNGATLVSSHANLGAGGSIIQFIGFELTGTDLIDRIDVFRLAGVGGAGNDNIVMDNLSVAAVPEPASLAIFGTICLVACGRRRKS